MVYAHKDSGRSEGGSKPMSEQVWIFPAQYIYLAGAVSTTILALWWDKDRPILYSDLVFRFAFGILTGVFLMLGVGLV